MGKRYSFMQEVKNQKRIISRRIRRIRRIAADFYSLKCIELSFYPKGISADFLRILRNSAGENSGKLDRKMKLISCKKCMKITCKKFVSFFLNKFGSFLTIIFFHLRNNITEIILNYDFIL